MTLVRIALIGIFLFCGAAVLGALSVIIALLFGPEDDYERDLADREQMEQLERWRNGKKH